ncbi:MAG TPA: TlpA disulfide reductase family protein [Saprospiraceae bacterium]|nr:TlpA disulfide reductase family protein [Saprospiraceae bacterium]
MKKFVLLPILLFTFCMAGAQKTARVHGTITHPEGDMVYLKYYKDYLTYDEIVVDSAKLDKKGNYRMQFTWAAPYPATFYHGDEITEMYISPGDDLRLTLDTKAFDETVKYEGKGAEINTYLAQKALLFSYINPLICKEDEQTFIHHVDSVYEAELAFFNQHFAGIQEDRPSIKAFKEYEHAELIYGWANTKTEYPGLNAYLNKRREPTKVSDRFMDFMNHISIKNEPALVSGAYQDFISGYVNREVSKLLQADTSLVAIPLKEKYIEQHFTGELRDFITAQWIYTLWTEEDNLAEGKRLFDKLNMHSPNNQYAGLLNETYTIVSKLSPGNPAPDFTCLDQHGEKVSLSDFKGKVVYMDVWATWCGPCRSEIPSAQKLIEDFEGEDVVFLCISVDDDVDAWKKLIKDKEMKGVHVNSSGNFDSVVAKLYNSKGIPHYILIDQEGKIVDINAKRPSGGIAEDLDALLK